VRPHVNRDWIALTLAIGMCTALNVMTIAVLYDALVNHADAGLSENATQILTGWGGGIIGILGTVFGYRAGSAQQVGTIRGVDE
jgi:hypothetical protein